ncbi:MAG TPA: MOSC domain-containing protein [Ktedonobacterales bacterium]|nr:MOSC domain-containing protein [Ktedonobacterales bacterium]
MSQLASMRIVSVNVGLPRTVESHGRAVRTAIFKSAVAGPTAIRHLNLDGDRQADLSVHGGPDKAVYAYAAEHYDAWRAELPEVDFPFGAFGENLTIVGLREDDLAIGDRLRAGTAELIVRQPRIPCYKLGVRLGRDDILKRFLNSDRSGVYFAVAREGVVEAGDAVTVLERDPDGVRVAAINRLYRDRRSRLPTRLSALQRAADLPALPESWRTYFRERAARLSASSPAE